MVFCLIFSLFLGNSLFELLSKLRLFEFGSYEVFFLDGNLVIEYDDCIFIDFKSLAANDKKFREFLFFFEV